jgi:hypothetical protein
MRAVARIFDLVVLLVGVVMPMAAHFVAHHDWLFTFSLVALGLPGGYVFARHLQVSGLFSTDDSDISPFHRACLRYYWSVFPVMAGIVLAQLLVPGEFKGSDAVFVAFIVLTLSRLADVAEISRMYRKIELDRRYMMAPKTTEKTGLTSRPLPRPAKRNRANDS